MAPGYPPHFWLCRLAFDGRAVLSASPAGVAPSNTGFGRRWRTRPTSTTSTTPGCVSSPRPDRARNGRYPRQSGAGSAGRIHRGRPGDLARDAGTAWWPAGRRWWKIFLIHKVHDRPGPSAASTQRQTWDHRPTLPNPRGTASRLENPPWASAPPARRGHRRRRRRRQRQQLRSSSNRGAATETTAAAADAWLPDIVHRSAAARLLRAAPSAPGRLAMVRLASRRFRRCCCEPALPGAR